MENTAEIQKLVTEADNFNAKVEHVLDQLSDPRIPEYLERVLCDHFSCSADELGIVAKMNRNLYEKKDEKQNKRMIEFVFLCRNFAQKYQYQECPLLDQMATDLINMHSTALLGWYSSIPELIMEILSCGELTQERKLVRITSLTSIVLRNCYQFDFITSDNGIEDITRYIHPRGAKTHARSPTTRKKRSPTTAGSARRKETSPDGGCWRKHEASTTATRLNFEAGAPAS